MLNRAIARRYARALFELVQARAEARSLEETRAALGRVADAFESEASFRHLVLSPRFDRETKIRVFGSVLERLGIGSPLREFLMILVRKGRFRLIREVLEAYTEMVHEREGLIAVSARTAQALPPEDQRRVQAALERITGKKVRLRWEVDPALIGGVALQIGELVVDGTIRGRLQAIRKRLVEA